MKTSEFLKKHWELITSAIFLLSAILTVVVRTETVWHCMFPSSCGLKGSNQFGHMVFEPGFRIDISELRFFQWGSYTLFALSLLLGIAVFILVTLLRNKIAPSEAATAGS